jgi:hypothetical protein
VFFASCMRLCGVVGGFGGAATSGKERRKILQELSAVRMLQGKRSFSDGESSFVIFLGIRMQTLTSTKTPRLCKLSARCGCPGGSLDSRTGKDLLSRVWLFRIATGWVHQLKSCLSNFV